MVEQPASISVIIIVRNEAIDTLNKLITEVLNQSLTPSEIIFVDTSINASYREYIDEISENKSLLTSLKYIQSENSFPGKARNVGLNESSEEFIAFLDAKTCPTNKWLSNSFELIKNKKYDGIFGSTKFLASSKFQKLYKACSYGEKSHETVPGTIIRRDLIFNNNLFFDENARAAEDILWRSEIKRECNVFAPSDPTTSYDDLPKSIFELLKKYIRYSFDGAILDVQSNIKEGYMAIFLTLVFLLIPRWNYLLPTWDQHPLYIDNVTKKVYFLIFLIFISYYLIKRYFRNHSRSPFLTLIKYLTYLLIFFTIFRWNDVLTNYTESASLYIPHITKIFLIIIFVLMLLIRGIFRPIVNGVYKTELFPFLWLRVGLLGVFLDIIRAPIYIFGALIGIFRRRF
tara:strand:- start:9440 stop:10642 length:1203 start_codon:yes stop_codon:yes gene_type:complete